MAIETARVTPQLMELLEIVERACEIEVDDAFLERIRNYVANPITGLVPEAQKYAERGAHQLESALRAYEKADDKKLWRDYLDASYAELFLGANPRSSAPVESCYMNDEHVLNAEQFFQVREAMANAGFAMPQNFYEPADHIAMEWALLIFLLKRNDFDAASEFKATHMDPWVLKACTDMISVDDVRFYTAIANLAHAAMVELG